MSGRRASGHDSEGDHEGDHDDGRLADGGRTGDGDGPAGEPGLPPAGADPMDGAAPTG